MEEVQGDKFRGFMEDGPAPDTITQTPDQKIEEIFKRVEAREITPQLAKQRVNEIIGELTLIDPMTGLLSKRGIIRETNILIATSIRFQTPFTVLFMDGDHFKDINDSAGHEQGDNAIKAIGKAMGILRENDLASHLSGDEFVVLLPGTDLETAKLVAEKLQQSVTAQVKETVSEYKKKFTVTVGIAEFNPGQYQGGHLGRDQIEIIRRKLYRNADRAMYGARKDGARGQIGMVK